MEQNKHKFILLLLAITVATAIASTGGGGLVGANFGTIENSYSAGLIVGSVSNIGGLVGSNSGTVANSFFNSQTSGRTDNDGRGVPLTTTQMRQQSYFTNWNFTTIWGINANINDGFPFLRHINAGNITFHRVVFNSNGGSAIPYLSNISPGSQITAPSAPTRSDFTFGGWFLDLGLTTAWDFDSDIVNENITLYARWTSNTPPVSVTPIPPNAITPINVQIHNGSEIRPDVQVVVNGIILQRDIDYTVEFTNNIAVSSSATVTVKGISDYSGTATAMFTIVAPGIMIINVDWGNTFFIYDGSLQVPSASVAGDYEIKIVGGQSNAGSHAAVAQLVGEYPNVMLRNHVMPFTINPKELTVQWTNLGPFTFDWTVQVPAASVSDGETDIPLHVSGLRSGAGENIPVLAIIEDEATRRNYILRENTRAYTIRKRQINIVIEAERDERVSLALSTTERDTVNVALAPDLLPNRANLQNLISTLLGFNNFATDPDGQTDDISVFGTERPTVRIIDIPEPEIEASSRFGRSDDLVRYRLYLLRIETEGMLAENYQIGATEFFIRTDEFRPSFIRQNALRDSRYGIILENAVVSDFARISVITPERATVNLVILDNLGNVVFSETSAYGRVSNPPLQNADDNAIIWDLTNPSGRFVANGTYLIIAEATGISGRRYLYSARIGVSR
ncbi:MAG: InlB B-repeat-containing protein [Chitinivibrionia bacterium]|nr:InlB B-repeat-containing protein [Chitinivibrionia bacterium]